MPITRAFALPSVVRICWASSQVVSLTLVVTASERDQCGRRQSAENDDPLAIADYRQVFRKVDWLELFFNEFLLLHSPACIVR